MRYRVSYLMDEIWERAVETALDGQTDHGAARTLTLDGAVKCVQGRLPPPSLLERFENLEHLSIANIGVSSLEQFPRLKNLQKLILSDNRIAGGLEFLVQAGLESLRDLDLSNNRIQYIEDLAPLAQLRIVSLDLYECPVTRVKDYRSRVFAMIKSLNYLDKMDAEENERPETDDEEDDDEDDDEDDPGSGEIDGEERPRRDNGHSENIEGIVDMDEEEESDADEEEAETTRGPVGQANGLSGRQTNGYRVEVLSGEEIDDDDDDDDEGEGEGEDDDDNDSVEEVYEEDDMVEVYEVGRVSDDEEDGVDDDDDNDNDDDDDDDDEDDDEEDDEDEEEEVDNENRDGDFGEPDSTGRLTSTEGEIDGHEQGEEDVDGDGETGEEEQAVEDDGVFEVEDEEDEDYGAGYLVQPVGETEEHDGGGSDMDPGTEEGDAVEEEVEDDDEVHDLPPSSSHLKRKRVDNANEDPGTEEGDAVAEEVEDDDEVQDLPPSSSHLKRKRVDNANEEEDNGEDDDEDDDDDDDVQQAYSKSSSKKHH